VFTIKAHGLNINVEPDDCPDNPRGWDNAGTLVLFDTPLSRHEFGDPHEFRDWWHLAEWWQAMSVIGGVLLIVWDAGDGTVGCGEWDHPEAFDGFRYHNHYLGVIYMTVEQMRKEQMRDRGHAASVLRGEVEAFSQWRSGDVWGFTITDDDGTEYGHLWGCFGREYCEKEAIVEARHISEKLARNYCI
jgi:hypothetical protein